MRVLAHELMHFHCCTLVDLWPQASTCWKQLEIFPIPNNTEGTQ